MKKHIFGLPVMYFIPLLVMCLLGIVFGSIFDLSLSKLIVNQDSYFGKVIETYGMIFGYELIIISGVLLFKATKDSSKKAVKFLGYFLLIISIIVTIYFVADQIKETKEANKMFGFYQPLIISYIIASILSLLMLIFSFYIMRAKTKNIWLE